jgi:hypothetical protein
MTQPTATALTILGDADLTDEQCAEALTELAASPDCAVQVKHVMELWDRAHSVWPYDDTPSPVEEAEKQVLLGELDDAILTLITPAAQ